VGAALEGQHSQCSHQLVDGPSLQGSGTAVTGVEALLAREDETQPPTVNYTQQFTAIISKNSDLTRSTQVGYTLPGSKNLASFMLQAQAVKPSVRRGLPWKPVSMK
jgi:hypothetical protein